MADDDYAEMFGTETGDDNQQQEKPGGGGLRKQLEQALADLKAERERATKLDTQVRQHTIDSVFSELDVPEKVRKFYAGEPDKDKILEWCKEHADVFGIALDSGTEDDPEEKERNDQLRGVSQAGRVGFDAGDRSAETIAQSTEAGIRAGKLSEADVDQQINRMFGR